MPSRYQYHAYSVSPRISESRPLHADSRVKDRCSLELSDRCLMSKSWWGYRRRDCVLSQMEIRQCAYVSSRVLSWYWQDYVPCDPRSDALDLKSDRHQPFPTKSYTAITFLGLVVIFSMSLPITSGFFQASHQASLMATTHNIQQFASD